MSFKYQFILSFVILEVFFILLIVGINFNTINNSSKILTTHKSESILTFMEELLKVPISSYDLGTLDELVKKTNNLEHINSIVVLDSRNRVLSKKYNFNSIKIEGVVKLKQNKELKISDKTYYIGFREIFLNETLIGSVIIIFDTSNITTYIKNNQRDTIIIIIFQIFISTLLSYIIGNSLTNRLSNLARIARIMGQNKKIEVPNLNMNNEIGVLSNSLNNMYKKMNKSYNDLNQLNMIQEKQKSELLKLNKIKDAFLANMSHEFRTPLNSIIGLSSMMMKNKKNLLDTNSVKNLSIINSCGKDLTYLINDILDTSKLESGKLLLDNSTFSLYDLIFEIKEQFEPQVLSENINLEFVFDSKIKEVYSDKQRIKQIIMNILSNALKFTEEGKIRLLVSNDINNFFVTIKDDGIGIKEDKLESIFDRFKQADSSINKIYGGTGLGLAICRELVELLNGEITVESKFNYGSTFTFYIPLNFKKTNINNKLEKTIQVKEDIDNKNIVDNNDINKLQKVLILNNNPIELLDLVLKLKKDFLVEQVESLEELNNIGNLDKYISIYIDTEIINNNTIEKNLKFYKNDIYLISYKNEDIKEDLFYGNIHYIKKEKHG